MLLQLLTVADCRLVCWLQFDDQGIVNTDPRFIAVPDSFINLIPTGELMQCC